MIACASVPLPFHVPDPGDRPCDVCCLGLNSIDLVAVVASYPVADSKQPLEQFATLPGGQMATASAVCAKLGWRVRYLGAFGDDDRGWLARTSLAAASVDVSGAWTIAGATNQFALVVVDRATGSRTVLWNRHPALATPVQAITPELAASGRVLVVDCHETQAATVAASFARRAGTPTIIDVEKTRPGLDALLAQIDAVIAAESFPSEYTGYEDTGRALRELAAAFNAPLVCVTLGPEGSLAVCGGREVRTPGYRVACVDSTGAGDAFRGGFAAGCLAMPDGDVEDVLRYANAVAALNCRGLGAQGGMPTRAEVDQLMRAGA